MPDVKLSARRHSTEDLSQQVPALWKDRAKDLTRRCAKGAGMGDNVKIITEPEAAAIHALQMMDPHGLEVGQAFILCDCGGGTVGKFRVTTS